MIDANGRKPDEVETLNCGAGHSEWSEPLSPVMMRVSLPERTRGLDRLRQMFEPVVCDGRVAGRIRAGESGQVAPEGFIPLPSR